MLETLALYNNYLPLHIYDNYYYYDYYDYYQVNLVGPFI